MKFSKLFFELTPIMIDWKACSDLTISNAKVG